MSGDTITIILLGLLNLSWLFLGILWEHRAAVATTIVLALLVGILNNTSITASIASSEGKALRDELERLCKELTGSLTGSLDDIDENGDRLHDDLVRLEEEIKALRSQSADDVARIRKSLARLQVEIESWRADAWRSEHKEDDTQED